MNNDFQLVYIDRDEFNSLLIQIEFKGQIICTLDKENGNNKMRIQFYYDLYDEYRNTELSFSVDEFIQVIIYAKEQLSLCP